MAEIVIELASARNRTASGIVVFALGAALLVLTLFVVGTGEYKILLVPACLACLAGVAWALPTVYRRPEWLLSAVTLVYLVITVPFLSEQLRGALHYGLLALFCFPMLLKLYRAEVLDKGGFRLFCAYFGWALVTLTFSVAPLFSLGRLFGSLLGFAAIAICVSDVDSEAQTQRLLLAFFVPCMLMNFASLIAAVMLPHGITWATPLDGLDRDYVASMHAAGISITGIDRFRGISGNPNDIGALMLITVASAAACWKRATSGQRKLLAATMILAAALALEADSRSPFVGLVIGAALYVIWRYRMRGVLAVASLGILTIAALYLHGLGSGLVGRGDVETLTGRTEIWAFAIQRIKQRPLIGYGYEVGGAILLSRYFPLWYGPWDQGPHSSLHSGYLNHAIGVGLPATALWLFIVIRPWVFVFSQKDDPWNLKTIALLVVVPLLVLNLTEATVGDFSSYTSLLFGLVWAIAERYRSKTLVQTSAEQQRQFESLPAALQVFR